MESAWSSLEEYFALNASIERVFRDSRGSFNSGPERITVKLVTGLHTAEFTSEQETGEFILSTKQEITSSGNMCCRLTNNLVPSRPSLLIYVKV